MERKRSQTDDSLLNSPPGKIIKTEDSMDVSNKEEITKLITLDSPEVSFYYYYYYYYYYVLYVYLNNENSKD